MESLYKVNKSETKGKLKELQKFINDFSNATNLEEACKLFSGKTLNISSSNGFVNNVIKLHKNYPKLSGIVEDDWLIYMQKGKVKEKLFTLDLNMKMYLILFTLILIIVLTNKGTNFVSFFIAKERGEYNGRDN